jgi:peptidyl-prolyl cis-trans isomerase D
MLQWIHDHLSRAYWLVLAPLIVAFAFWGIQGVADLGAGSEREFKVNGERIALERVREAYQQQLAELAKVYPDEVPQTIKTQMQDALIDRFVNATLIDQAVRAQRYSVADEKVREAIRQLPYFQVGGQFSPELYFSTLKARNISPEQFEADERAELATRQLESGLRLSAFATLPEVERAAVLQGEKRDFRGLALPFERFLNSAHPTEAELTTYFNAHQAEFKSPDTVALSYVELKLDDAATHPSEATLQAYFDTIKTRFSEPEKRRARHILIKVSTNPAEAQAKAAKIYREASQPNADFAALARQYSEDSGSAQQGGDLGLAEKSYFVGPFADAMFAMRAGEIKGPVKSEFGYHIIKLEEIVPGKIAEFAKVRAQVESEYRKNEAERQFNERQEQLERLAFEASGSLNPLAKALNVGINTVADYHAGVNTDPVLSNPKVLQAAFSADVLAGQNSRPIEIAPGDVVVLRVAEHRPPAPLGFEAVRSQVTAALRQQMALARLNAAAQEIITRAQAGKSLEVVLEESAQTYSELRGLKLSASQVVARQEKGVNALVLKALFKLAAHIQVAAQPVLVENHDAWIIQLLSVRPGEPAADGRQWAQALYNQQSSSDVEVYLARLRDTAKVVLNKKILFE